MLSEAVLSIWIKGRSVPQGKFCYLSSKPCYIANMTKNKEWKNYSGYSIAKRILDVFSTLKLRPLIIYKRQDLGQHYIATPSLFKKKGILVRWGEHQQWCLPLKNWIAKSGMPEEPKDLPIMDIQRWIRDCAIQKENRIIEDVSLPNEIRFRLREEALKKGWYQPANG